MTIQKLMQEIEISRYRLYKISGIPWAILADIYSGKSPIDQCDEDIISRLSKALELSIEELLELKTEPEINVATGKPCMKTYLETGLSMSVQKAINDYLQGEKGQVSYLDCLSDELYGSINADFWAGLIMEEQANYLREKYLGIGKEDCTE